MMPQRNSWLAVQTLINQYLTNLAILAEVRRQMPKIGWQLILGIFSHSLYFTLLPFYKLPVTSL